MKQQFDTNLQHDGIYNESDDTERRETVFHKAIIDINEKRLNQLRETWIRNVINVYGWSDGRARTEYHKINPYNEKR